MKEEKFTIDLHGCLDSIALNGFNGSTVQRLNSSWVWAYNWDQHHEEDRGFLVNLNSRHVLDTGIFMQPAKFELLPEGRGFLRITPAGLTFLDTGLCIVRTVSTICTSPIQFKRTGDHLLVLDSLAHGFLESIDLRSLRTTGHNVPLSNLGGTLLGSIENHRSEIWIDEQNAVQVLFSRGGWNYDSMAVIDERGHIARMGIGNHSLGFDWSKEDGLRIKASPVYSLSLIHISEPTRPY